jgi:hypothetical protein
MFQKVWEAALSQMTGDLVERRFAVLRRNLDYWDATDRFQHQTD